MTLYEALAEFQRSHGRRWRGALARLLKSRKDPAPPDAPEFMKVLWENCETISTRYGNELYLAEFAEELAFGPCDSEEK